MVESTENIHFKDWFENNCDELHEQYLEYVRGLNDSWTHKNLLLTKEACFVEWCEEKYIEGK